MAKINIDEMFFFHIQLESSRNESQAVRCVLDTKFHYSLYDLEEDITQNSDMQNIIS